MESDPEVAAMSRIAELLNPLEPGVQRRVLDWATARFIGATADAGGFPPTDRRPAYQDFVDLFHAADPKSAADAALVAAYWYQQVLGQPMLRAQDLNGALRNLGHGLANITDALRTLEQRKPPQIRQSGKSGRSPQARKSYKLTAEGAARVEALVEARRATEDGNG
jgi:hypothetical protein